MENMFLFYSDTERFVLVLVSESVCEHGRHFRCSRFLGSPVYSAPSSVLAALLTGIYF